jgi:hypothetical protein
MVVFHHPSADVDIHSYQCLLQLQDLPGKKPRAAQLSAAGNRGVVCGSPLPRRFGHCRVAAAPCFFSQARS